MDHQRVVDNLQIGQSITNNAVSVDDGAPGINCLQQHGVDQEPEEGDRTNGIETGSETNDHIEIVIAGAEEEQHIHGRIDPHPSSTQEMRHGGTHLKAALVFSIRIAELASAALYGILSGHLGGQTHTSKILFRLCTASLMATIVCSIATMLVIHGGCHIRHFRVVVNVMLFVNLVVVIASVILCFTLLQI